MSYNDSVAPDAAHIDVPRRSACRRRKPGTCTKMCVAILAAFPLFAMSGAYAADNTERTVMPDFCSRRDVNCVLPDTAGSRVVVTPGVAGAAAGTIAAQPDASGVTTVVTPSSSGVPSVSTAPPVLTAPATTATIGGTTSGTTSSSASSASSTAPLPSGLGSGAMGTTTSGMTSGGAAFGGSR